MAMSLQYSSNSRLRDDNNHDDGKNLFHLYHPQYNGEQPIRIRAKSKEEAIDIAIGKGYPGRRMLYWFKYRLKHRDYDGTIDVIAINEKEAQSKALREHYHQTKQRLSIDGFIEVKDIHE